MMVIPGYLGKILPPRENSELAPLSLTREIYALLIHGVHPLVLDRSGIVEVGAHSFLIVKGIDLVHELGASQSGR